MPCYTMNYIKSFTITDKIYGLYSDDDLRKSKYIWTNCDFHGYAKTPIIATNLTQEPTDPQYYFYAYYSPTSFNHVDISDKFCFRAAEAYLIKAEAEAYMGHEDAARQALNTLRAQRYAPGTDYAVTATGDDLIKTIRNERERPHQDDTQRAGARALSRRTAMARPPTIPRLPGAAAERDYHAPLLLLREPQLLQTHSPPHFHPPTRRLGMGATYPAGSPRRQQRHEEQ